MPVVPQGLTEEQFADLSARVREAVAHLSLDRNLTEGEQMGGSDELDCKIYVDAEQTPDELAALLGR
jgi:hypothetical protein